MSNTDELPAPFDDYEVHGVRKFGRGANRYCERVPDENAQFWSLYGHVPGQGFECIGNYKSRAFAEQVYARITGRAYGSGKRSAEPETSVNILQLLRDRRQVAVIWCIEDVQSLRPDLTDDQAWEVLEQAYDVHDCEWGFTWTHLQTVADDMFPKQPSTTKE